MSSETREVMHDQHTHPVGATKTYWVIGIILTVVTFIEISAYFYEDWYGVFATPTVLIVSLFKFVLVVMFYMHLKYDSKIFTGVFVFPMALATLVIGSLILLYHVLHPLR
jgi:cytochrome c oxidase subunit IV